MASFIGLFFKDSNPDMLSQFIEGEYTLRIFKRLIYLLNKKFSDVDTIKQSIFFFNIVHGLIVSEKFKTNFKSLEDKLSSLLYHIISQIDAQAPLENVVVLVKEAFIACICKVLFKRELNLYMQQSFREFQLNRGFFNKWKNDINSQSCVESLLKIDCDPKIKPLLNYQVALGNRYLTQDVVTAGFPPAGIIRNLFHSVERNKQLILDNKPLPPEAEQEMEDEYFLLHACINKLWTNYSKNAIKFLPNFFSFINAIGIHSKVFVEKGTRSFFLQEVK